MVPAIRLAGGDRALDCISFPTVSNVGLIYFGHDETTLHMDERCPPGQPLGILSQPQNHDKGLERCYAEARPRERSGYAIQECNSRVVVP